MFVVSVLNVMAWMCPCGWNWSGLHF